MTGFSHFRSWMHLSNNNDKLSDHCYPMAESKETKTKKQEQLVNTCSKKY